VPLDWRFPHGWNISAGGYAIMLEGPSLDTYIPRWWLKLTPEQRVDPDWVVDNPLWLPLF
jgi:hypothetical protein